MKKRVLSLLLALSMMLLCALPGFAASPKKDYSGYQNYVALGDSITSGYGLEPLDIASSIHMEDLLNLDWSKLSESGFQLNMPLTGYKRVAGSFPDLVAKQTGSKLYQYAFPAWRSVETRYVIDRNYEGDRFNFLLTGQTEAEALAFRAQTINAIENADLITINTGSNDLLLTALFKMIAVAYDYNEAETLVYLHQKLDAGNTLEQIISDVIGYAEVAKIVSDVVAAAVDGMYLGFENCLTNWDAIIKAIHKLNPNATVVALSYYNPFTNYKMWDTSLIPIGSALEGIFIGLNANMKAKAATLDYTYVDVRNVEVNGIPTMNYVLSGADLGEMVEALLYGIHPTVKGHQWMAERVMKKLPECPKA